MDNSSAKSNPKKGAIVKSIVILQILILIMYKILNGVKM